MQKEDAARRLAILRGEQPLPDPQFQDCTSSAQSHKRPPEDTHTSSFGHRSKRPRRRHGENDTDFELRLAYKQQKEAESFSAQKYQHENGVSLTDERGHIKLFEVSEVDHSQSINEESIRKKRLCHERGDPTLRFAHAAGRDKSVVSKENPWYQTGGSDVDALRGAKGTDVFGKPDQNRASRDVARLNMADPLASMRQGAKKVREIKKQRQTERKERERELKMMRKEERQERRINRGKRREEERRRDEIAQSNSGHDSLDSFSIDAQHHAKKKWREPHRSRNSEHRSSNQRHRKGWDEEYERKEEWNRSKSICRDRDFDDHGSRRSDKDYKLRRCIGDHRST